MEFREVVRRRRMIRDFAPRPVPRPVLDRVLETALHAPSAGFAQGLELVVLDEAHDVERFWHITDPRARKRDRTNAGPPVVVVAVANRNAYLERYSEPDKQGLGMDSEEGWPVPYWDLDAAMSVMLMLLAAVDEGLGAWFFGIFAGEPELSDWLGIPEGCRPIGALGLGYPAPGERRGGSALVRRRRGLEEVVHRGRFS
jgi:nitroreductase